MPTRRITTRKPRCSRCQRVFFTTTARPDGTLSVTIPDYGLPMAVVDPQRLTYLLTCTKCGNREIHQVPIAPPLASPTVPTGRANVITGGLTATGLPDAVALDPQSDETHTEDTPQETGG